MTKRRLFPLILLAVLLLSGCDMGAENTPTFTAVVPEPETKVPETEATALASAPDSQETAILLTFGNTVVTGALHNSETAQAFLDRLPLTIPMNRYADREYYAAIPELPENGEKIPDFENGDITYYTTGKSLAIFFGNADTSSQSDLIRIGHITSDLSLFDDMADSMEVTISLAEEGADMTEYDFSVFTNVEITGTELSGLSDEQLAVLYQQARYCQAMTEADTATMGEIVSEDQVFTHMSGRQQTREEYFADVADGSLTYYSIGIENPVVEVNGELACVTYTSILDANAYGAIGTYRMEGAHWFEKRNGVWYLINTLIIEWKEQNNGRF